MRVVWSRWSTGEPRTRTLPPPAIQPWSPLPVAALPVRAAYEAARTRARDGARRRARLRERAAFLASFLLAAGLGLTMWSGRLTQPPLAPPAPAPAAASRPAGAPAASPPPAPPTWRTAPVAAAARSTGLPAALIAAVAQVESQGQADAVSPAGAKGLMQLEPPTAAALGVRDIFDPLQNAVGGARYLAIWLRTYGGPSCVAAPQNCPAALRLALASYNAGPGAVRRYNGVPPYPETQRYITEVTALFHRYLADS